MMKRYRLDPDNPRQLTEEEARRLDETPIDYSDIPPLAKIDWSQCPDVESVPGRCSGAWVVKGTRIMVQGILDNACDCTPEEIAGPDIFPDLSADLVRRILAFAAMTDEPTPPFRGEEYLSALLLQMLLEHCEGALTPPETGQGFLTAFYAGTPRAQIGDLDSYGIKANEDAMTALHEQGYIEITEHSGGASPPRCYPKAGR